MIFIEKTMLLSLKFFWWWRCTCQLESTASTTTAKPWSCFLLEQTNPVAQRWQLMPAPSYFYLCVTQSFMSFNFRERETSTATCCWSEQWAVESVDLHVSSSHVTATLPIFFRGFGLVVKCGDDFISKSVSSWDDVPWHNLESSVLDDWVMMRSCH